jgi:hypothetical protein
MRLCNKIDCPHRGICSRYVIDPIDPWDSSISYLNIVNWKNCKYFVQYKIEDTMSPFNIIDDGIAKHIQESLLKEIEYRRFRITDEWRYKEAKCVHNAVNLERCIIGKQDIDIYPVLKIMKNARGHPDFVYRVAKACEQLVMK